MSRSGTLVILTVVALACTVASRTVVSQQTSSRDTMIEPKEDRSKRLISQIKSFFKL